jgi:hypothetical protein
MFSRLVLICLSVVICCATRETRAIIEQPTSSSRSEQGNPYFLPAIQKPEALKSVSEDSTATTVDSWETSASSPPISPRERTYQRLLPPKNPLSLKRRPKFAFEQVPRFSAASGSAYGHKQVKLRVLAPGQAMGESDSSHFIPIQQDSH